MSQLRLNFSKDDIFFNKIAVAVSLTEFCRTLSLFNVLSFQNLVIFQQDTDL